MMKGDYLETLIELDYLIVKSDFFGMFSVETITIGDKKIGIRTSILEEKATACNMLCCYAAELKEGFYPWIDQVSNCIQSMMSMLSPLFTCF